MPDSFKIVLVGAGQLGSRHLQGLAKISLPSEITVVDPSKQSLETAEARFNEIPPTGKITSLNFTESFGDIPDNTDLCIVATNSDVRLELLRKILSKCSVRYFILEKVLFQCEEEFQEAEALLNKSRAMAWVNVPRRIYAGYSQIKKILGDRRIDFLYEGSDWGIGSNSIHLIDLVSYLTDDVNYEISTCLDPLIHESKRRGFIEFTGTVDGKFSKSSTFHLFSSADKLPGNDIMRLTAQDITIEIDYLDAIAVTTDASGQKTVLKDFRLPYQSEMTNLVSEELLAKGTCSLPCYKEAATVHIPMVNALLSAYNKISGKDHRRCPIT